MSDAIRLYTLDDNGMWVYPKCLQVETYLRLHGVQFCVTKCTSDLNSPTGQLPAIEIEKKEICSGIEELKKIGLNLDANLSPAEIFLYSNLVKILDNATLWSSWNSDSFRELYQKLYPAPLSTFLCWQSKLKIERKLRALDIQEVQDIDVESVYSILSQKLGENSYLLGSSPCSVDAQVYAHLSFHKLTFDFGDKLKKFPRLMKYIDNITSKHFDTPLLNAPNFTPQSRARPTSNKSKKKKMTEEEKQFIKRRNTWLVMAFGVTIAYLAFGNLLDFEIVEELLEDDLDE